MESSIRGFREVKRVEAFFFSEHFSHRTAHICPSIAYKNIQICDRLCNNLYNQNAER